jgi:hypothetical protein
MIEYKLYKSPIRAIKLILVSLAFVLAGIFILNDADGPKFFGWCSIIFFGFGVLVGIYQLFDRRPQIIINEFGIFDRTANKDFINWEIIKNAYLANVHGQKFICLVLDEKFEPSKTKGRLFKKGAMLSKALGFQELNISLVNIKIDEHRFTNFILAMRTAEKNQRAEMIKVNYLN